MVSARVGGHRGQSNSQRAGSGFRVSNLLEGQGGRVLEESDEKREAPFSAQIESLVNSVFIRDCFGLKHL